MRGVDIRPTYGVKYFHFHFLEILYQIMLDLVHYVINSWIPAMTLKVEHDP